MFRKRFHLASGNKKFVILGAKSPNNSKNLCCIPNRVRQRFLIMSECRKTFAVQKGLCRAAMCGWAGGVHLHTSGGGENIYHSHRSELDQLIDHDPAEYARLVLHIAHYSKALRWSAHNIFVDIYSEVWYNAWKGENDYG